MSYFKNLRLYDQWNPEKRLLIYYEDLIIKPQETYEKLVEFLGEKPIYIDPFLESFEEHKQNAIKIYTKYQVQSVTQGNAVVYHSKELDDATRRAIDKKIAQLYPGIWNKYLKHRYSEEVIQEQGLYKDTLILSLLDF